MTDPILEMTGVNVQFERRRGLLSRSRDVLKAVNDVSLSIAPGEALGLVGESGSGKSTVARAIEGLLPVSSGSIRLAGVELVDANRAELRGMRRQFQMVFQDPYSSLDPSMSIESTLIEPLVVHKIANRAEATRRAVASIESVGLRASDLGKYPHEFSGGQRQRIAIARALMPSPDLLILDEAVSALDVSTRAQILQLLQDLRRELGLAYLFIGHDLAVVQRMSDRIAVMYLGKIVESGPADRVIQQPEHPYTASLMASVPRVRPAEIDVADRQRRLQVRTDPPDPWDPPSGCAFSSRCAFAMDKCRTVDPPLVEVTAGVASRCHLPAGADDEAAVKASRKWSRARADAGITAAGREDGNSAQRADTGGR